MRAVCDLAYDAQIELITQQAIAMTALLPHLDEGKTLPTVDDAVTEFHQWLLAEAKPSERSDLPPEDLDLVELLGVRG